jgi:hypothetical protein
MADDEEMTMAATAAPATKPDPNTRLDDVHFRLDDIERRLTKLETLVKPEAIAGMVHGVVASHIEALPKDSNYALIQTLRALIDQMAKPRVKTATAQLPSGPVKMTVVEHIPDRSNGGAHTDG